MKFGKFVTCSGIITTILGIIFHLQGRSMVGPESSFMYANPEWTAYGIQIIIIGIVTIVTGMVMIRKFSW